MTVGELAEYLRTQPSMRLHSATISRLLRQGKLLAFRVGSEWRASPSSALSSSIKRANGSIQVAMDQLELLSLPFVEVCKSPVVPPLRAAEHAARVSRSSQGQK
jgi:excisionase family DNA binding protein